jgi:ElaB/YqjD/DUF883 family membrane-anchored ribosome-binding protein
MESEEVIRRRMQQTREALTEKLETLEQKVASSVSAVTHTVANVKAKVDEGVESVKDVVDVQAHVERHPWLMLGGSVLCGYVLGNVLHSEHSVVLERSLDQTTAERPNRNGRNAPETHESEANGANWLGAFEPELKKLKSLALGVALGTVRELLTSEVPPHMADQLRNVIDAITKKAGGEPIPRSDWDAIKPAAQPKAGPECSEVTAQNSRW